MNRRGLLLGGLALLAAPAIVRADSLMKIVVPKITAEDIIASMRTANFQAFYDVVIFGRAFIQQEAGGLFRTIDPREYDPILDGHALLVTGDDGPSYGSLLNLLDRDAPNPHI